MLHLWINVLNCSLPNSHIKNLISGGILKRQLEWQLSCCFLGQFFLLEWDLARASTRGSLTPVQMASFADKKNRGNFYIINMHWWGTSESNISLLFDISRSLRPPGNIIKTAVSIFLLPLLPQEAASAAGAGIPPLISCNFLCTAMYM